MSDVVFREPSRETDLEIRINDALEVAVAYGGSSDIYHLHWVIDQMVRHLARDRYRHVVEVAMDNGGCDWHVGIAP